MPAALRVPNAAVGVLLAVGAAQASDAITFVRLMIDYGAAAEGNPLVASMAASGHLGLLIAAKAALVVLIVSLVAVGHPRYPVAMGALATFGMGAGLVGAWSNVRVLLDPFAR